MPLDITINAKLTTIPRPRQTFMNTRHKSFPALVVSAALLLFAQAAGATLIGVDSVDGRNSLYTTDWGHPYTGIWDGSNGSEHNAIGAGNPARAFAVAGVAFGFTPGDQLRLTATGCVIDLGSQCTGPDYMGGLFRELPVYGLIGVWSDSATAISPIDHILPNPAFFIGALLEFAVPDFGAPLYLYMATNDGNFSDNGGAYTVQIERLAGVPEPGVLALLLGGLLLATGGARPHRQRMLAPEGRAR